MLPGARGIGKSTALMHAAYRVNEKRHGRKVKDLRNPTKYLPLQPDTDTNHGGIVYCRFEDCTYALDFYYQMNPWWFELPWFPFQSPKKDDSVRQTIRKVKLAIQEREKIGKPVVLIFGKF